MKYPCAKQKTVAIIVSGENYYIGSNWCLKDIKTCPRGNAPTGTEYEKCKDICQQNGHAEIDAIRKAGDRAKGATLFLVGHYYACDSCLMAIEKAGIKQVVFVDREINFKS